MEGKNGVEFSLCKGNSKIGISQGPLHPCQQNHPQILYAENKLKKRKKKKRIDPIGADL